MLETKIGIYKSHEDAILPTQNIDDIGFDIYSVEDVEIKSLSVGKIDTGLKFSETPKMPINLSESYFGLDAFSELETKYKLSDSCMSLETKIEGRSGLASKGIFPVGGIVDPSYRGPIIVCLFNSTSDSYFVKKGDKIAQLVLRPVLANTKDHKVNFEFRDKQEETERGEKGFGSSGK
jgi:dUTP pyrophosphatase